MIPASSALVQKSSPGDILVGKITPKGETQLSALKRSCSGPSLVRRPAMCVTARCGSTRRDRHVIGAKVFAARALTRMTAPADRDDEEEARLLKDQNDEVKIIESVRKSYYAKMYGKLLEGKTTASALVDDKGKVLLVKKGDSSSTWPLWRRSRLVTTESCGLPTDEKAVWKSASSS
jgi:DNA-directed RNA polymerase subunit beta